MNILLIMGHPRKDSLSAALASSYFQGAVQAGQKIKQINICEMEFERDVLHHSPNSQKLENCILDAQNLILWADHLVFIYPTWWGTFPALLKAFFDRTFTEGFAFEEVEGGTGYKKLLNNKSAEIFTTMDTPAFLYKHYLKAPGHHAIGKATLHFCGIYPISFKNFGPVRASTKEQRESWKRQVKNSALKFSDSNKIRQISYKRNFAAWLKAVRFQFYPMSLLGFLLGSLVFRYMEGSFDLLIFILGCLWIFALEFTTVLVNEKVDFESDRQNKYYGPFTGGSRVLVDGMLTFKQINKGIIAGSLLTVFLSILLVFFSPSPMIRTTMVILISAFLAIGYTAPPFKIGYKGFAALDVGITHSFGVVVSGFVFQGGDWHNPLIWLICIPLFLSILPSIILAGIPDRYADRAIGKRTLAVRFGRKRAAGIAMISTVATVTALILVYAYTDASIFYPFLIFLSLLHALLLVHQLLKYVKKPSPEERIDGLMIVSLSFIFWFVLFPIISILNN